MEGFLGVHVTLVASHRECGSPWKFDTLVLWAGSIKGLSNWLRDSALMDLNRGVYGLYSACPTLPARSYQAGA